MCGFGQVIRSYVQTQKLEYSMLKGQPQYCLNQYEDENEERQNQRLDSLH